MGLIESSLLTDPIVGVNIRVDMLCLKGCDGR